MYGPIQREFILYLYITSTAQIKYKVLSSSKFCFKYVFLCQNLFIFLILWVILSGKSIFSSFFISQLFFEFFEVVEFYYLLLYYISISAVL